jgi:3-hydroxyisobutyrate dehydrogenase
MQKQQTVIIQNISYDLSALEKDCWLRLLNGAVKSRDALHLMSIATKEGEEIGLRTVVLRSVKPTAKKLFFHTDARSRKCEDLSKDPVVSLLLYDAAAKIQLGIRGKAVLHSGNLLAKEAWDKTSVGSRRSYLSLQPPSGKASAANAGLPDYFAERDPTPEESEEGWKNFVVVEIGVYTMDWLWLDAKGQRRALFEYNKEGTLMDKSWLVP